MNIKQSKHKNPFLAGTLTILFVIGIAVGVRMLQNRENSQEAKRLSAAENSKKSTVAVTSTPKQVVVVLTPTTTTPAPSPTPIPTTVAPKAPPTITPTPITPAPVAPAPPPVTYSYKDGTYSAVGSFPVPGLITKINVTIVVVNDIVTDSSVTIPPGSDPTSTNYDNKFIANYKPFVIGKALSTLSLSKVSAASLTPNGFNNALNQIRVTAKG